MSDEDDYMSEDVLRGVCDKPTGIASSRAHQRQLRIHARFEESRSNVKPKRQTLAEREKERRDEALSKPISEESKGFALMAKMGFKPGMTLGKKREVDDSNHKPIKEPIGIEIKINRKGLGHEAEENSQRSEKVEAVMRHMKEQAAKHEELIVDYKNRRRMESTFKEVLKDIYTSRRICEELDSRQNLKVPKVSWYWRSYPQYSEMDEPKIKSSRLEQDNDEDVIFKYSNGLIAPAELEFTALEDLVVRDKLNQITEFLRSHHLFCIWCGSHFQNTDELKEQCPGNTRHSHDGEDE